MEPEVLYIYVRVSTMEQQNKDLSPARQKDLGIEAAERMGMNYKIMEEGGESASHENFDNRPVLAELLRLVKEGVAKYLFVFDQTRLSRNNLTKVVITENLKRKGVQLYTHSKAFDFNKDEDVLTFRILEVIESYETSMRKARFQAGYVSGNKKGKYLKGIPPFGYTKDKEGYLVPDEEESKIFLQMVDLYLNHGWGTGKIADWLNQNNIATKTTKVFKKGFVLNQGVRNRKITTHITKSPWNPGTINSMFKNAVYTGNRKFKVAPGKYEITKCEPLISKETFDKIQTVRAVNAIIKKKEDKYFYLLKRLIQCGNCGKPYHGRVKPNRSEFSYRCNSKRLGKSSCTGRGINIMKLDQMVWEAFVCSSHYHQQLNENVLKYLNDDTELIASIKQLEKQFQKLIKEENKLNSSLKELLKNNINRRMPESVFNEVLDEINAAILDVNDRKDVLWSNINRFKLLSVERGRNKSILQKDLDSFYFAQTDIDNLAPPFLTSEHEEKARELINKVIKNIFVSYNSEERVYTIEIEFHKIHVLNTGNDGQEIPSVKKIAHQKKQSILELREFNKQISQLPISSEVLQEVSGLTPLEFSKLSIEELKSLRRIFF